MLFDFEARGQGILDVLRSRGAPSMKNNPEGSPIYRCPRKMVVNESASQRWHREAVRLCGYRTSGKSIYSNDRVARIKHTWDQDQFVASLAQAFWPCPRTSRTGPRQSTGTIVEALSETR